MICATIFLFFFSAGNITFGELVDVYCLVPMIIVAVLLSFGGLIVCKLPNTTKTDLPE